MTDALVERVQPALVAWEQVASVRSRQRAVDGWRPVGHPSGETGPNAGSDDPASGSQQISERRPPECVARSCGEAGPSAVGPGAVTEPVQWPDESLADWSALGRAQPWATFATQKLNAGITGECDRNCAPNAVGLAAWLGQRGTPGPTPWTATRSCWAWAPCRTTSRFAQVWRIVAEVTAAAKVVGVPIAEFFPRQVMPLTQILQGFPLISPH